METGALQGISVSLTLEKPMQDLAWVPVAH